MTKRRPCQPKIPRDDRWLTKLVTLTFLLGSIYLSTAADGASKWTSIGPPRGIFSSLVAAWNDPDTVYASDEFSDLWISDDGGSTWTFVTRLPSYGRLAGVSPSQASVVYWESYSENSSEQGLGLYRSTDSGLTWQRVLEGRVESLVAVSPTAPQTAWVYLADETVWRSDDDGLTWLQVGPIPGYEFAGFTLAVDPMNPSTLYAAGQPGVAKSIDGGAHWYQVFSFSEPPFDSVSIALFALPTTPTSLVLATIGFSAPTADDRVFASTDAGATWVEMRDGLPGPPLVHVGFAAGSTGAVYAAVARLDDPTQPNAPTEIYRAAAAGAPWQRTASLPHGQGTLVADNARPERLYALGNAGVLLSSDFALSFARPAKAPSAVEVSQVLARPGVPGALYVAALDDPSRPFQTTFSHSVDGGATWTSFAPPQQDSGRFSPSYSRLVLGAAPGTLYSVAFPDASAPALVSRNDGVSWRALPLPPFHELTLDLAGDPKRPNTLTELGCRFVITSIWPPPLQQALCTALRLYTTDTAGRSWRQVAGLRLSRASTGGGELRLDPATPSTVYVLVAGSLYKSTATHPQLIALPLPLAVVDLVIDPRRTSTLYAAIRRSRPVVKSTNGGKTWTNSSVGLPAGVTVAALAIDPITNRTLYASSSAGLFVTNDGASSWHAVDAQGFPTGVPLSSVTLSPNGTRTVYLGTVGSGVYKLISDQ